jgi:hypothetical protein
MALEQTWSLNIAAIAYGIHRWNTLATIDHVKFTPMLLNSVVRKP